MHMCVQSRRWNNHLASSDPHRNLRRFDPEGARAHWNDMRGARRVGWATRRGGVVLVVAWVGYAEWTLSPHGRAYVVL
eukprot:1671498-Pyramimonas_sp.AAC.1